jgi:hypothetical protein
MTGSAAGATPELSVSVTKINFGGVKVGTAKESRSFTITNTGDAPLQTLVQVLTTCDGAPVCDNAFFYGSTQACEATDSSPGVLVPDETHCLQTLRAAPTHRGLITGVFYACYWWPDFATGELTGCRFIALRVRGT